MKTYEISRDGRQCEAVEAVDERAALALFAAQVGIDRKVKRDGAGVLYVGDGAVGRYHAREALDPVAVAAWRRRYTHGQPFGMPVVLADAIELVGGLR